MRQQLLPDQLRQALWTPANLISALRIPLGLLFLLLAGQPAWELLILLAAALSDFLDGWIARQMGQAGGMGALIDPLCDKGFVLLVVLSYALQQRQPLGILLLVMTRDLYLLTLSAVLRLSGHWRQLHLAARPAGKIVTVLQLLYFAAMALQARSMLQMLPVVILILSLLACADYTLEVKRQLEQP